LDGMGLIALEGGDMRKAADNFRKAVASRPNYPEALENLGDVLLRLHDWAGARQAFTQALEQKPDNAMATYGLAKSLRQSGDAKTADATFAKARALMQRDVSETRANGETNRGLKLWYAGDLAGAAKAFRSALTLDPTYAEAHNNLGGVLWQLHQTDQATQEFMAAVRYRPDFVKAHNNLGEALLSQGKLADAVQQFKAAIALRPGFVTPHLNLGTALARQGKLTDAEAEFREALVLAPDSAMAHFELGLLLASGSKGLTPQARSEIAEGVRLDPKLSASLPQVLAKAMATGANTSARPSSEH
jgi:tetratricopeptide (TPR) repeat protein